MKLKDGLVLRNIAGENVVIPVGSRNVDFNGMIRLNETGAFIWARLQSETSAEDLVKALTDEYQVDEDTARQDVLNILEKLKQAELLE